MTTSTSSSIILGSRGSMLALWQANFVADKIRLLGHNVEIKTWKTTGDIVQDRFLHEIGGKGLFIKELEDAMANGQAHLAVHSLKDLPAKIPEKFKLAAVMQRHSHHDAIIFRKDIYKKFGLSKDVTITASILKSLGQLTVATSSLRRKSLLTGSCPNVTTLPVRGNVDTRLKKLESEKWDAIILAEASLERLGLKDLCSHKLDATWFVPCAGQGALAIETPMDSNLSHVLSNLECAATRSAVNIERAVLARLGGDCTMPFGCLVSSDEKNSSMLSARAVVLSNEGESVSATKTASKEHPDIERFLEQEIIIELRKNGANDVLAKLGITTRI